MLLVNEMEYPSNRGEFGASAGTVREMAGWILRRRYYLEPVAIKKMVCCDGMPHRAEVPHEGTPQ